VPAEEEERKRPVRERCRLEEGLLDDEEAEERDRRKTEDKGTAGRWRSDKKTRVRKGLRGTGGRARERRTGLIGEIRALRWSSSKKDGQTRRRALDLWL
jgi:hypothetical protein